MTRVVKNPEERRSEILDTAQRLFVTKGYTKTTIMDILNEIGIAKGTFYYYYKSKEEVMDAIISRIVAGDVAMAKKTVSNPNMTAIDKLFTILFSQSPTKVEVKEQMLEQIHKEGNAEMHQKSLVETIRHMSPVLADVVRQGIDEKTMQTDYPQETIEFLLAAQNLFDEDLFHWSQEEMIQRTTAFITIMESSLGADKGSFDKIKELIIKKEGN